jgi:hypothetical protein
VKVRAGTVVAFLAAAAALGVAATAQGQNRGGPPAPPPTPRASAPVDLTGYWVAFVSEDWRRRMVTPPKGDFRGIPLNRDGRKVMDAWDPAADEAAGNQCKAYGAAAIMRLPTRLHVTWQDDSTLRVDTDTGAQTRTFRFAVGLKPEGAPSWQGQSTARWERPYVPLRGQQELAGSGPGPNRGGSLTVVTTNLRAGYLRWNGVPYSEDATVTEYFDVAPHPTGGQLLIVTTVVTDPLYLERPYTLSSQFKKEGDGSRWDPTPCTSTW